MKASMLLAVVIVFAVLISACSPSQPAAPTAASKEGGTVAPGPAVNQWDTLVAEAKKEGRLTVYTSQRPEARDAITKAVREKYGIEVEFVAGRASEVVTKLRAERQAGLYNADIGLMGPTTFANELLPMNALIPLDPVLLLPEVKDTSKWLDNTLPYLDKGHMAFRIVLTALPFYTRNTDQVKEGEISVSTDLLNPKWKGKLAMNDPSLSGNAADWFAFMTIEIMGMDKGLQFMRDLARQEPHITRDERLLPEWVAKGKYSIGIGSSPSAPAEFIKVKAPIAFIETKEPKALSSGSGLLEMFKDGPHPNASRLFVNWILSKEGGAIYAPASEYPSARLDVPQDAFLLALVPRAGDVDPVQKYDRYEERKGELRKVAAEIFGPLLK